MINLNPWSVSTSQDEKCHVPYLKNFLKKLIKEVESTGGSLLDEFYERYAFYMASLKVRLRNKGVCGSFFFLLWSCIVTCCFKRVGRCTRERQFAGCEMHFISS